MAAGNLALFDGNPKTNQCHINALQTALLYQKQQQDFALSSRDEKFLILCFFTNFGLRNQDDREQFIAHFLSPEEINSSFYIGLFKNNALKDRCAPPELGHMLFDLVNVMGPEKLEPATCKLTPRDPAPTYPKFLGAQRFLDAVKSNQVPILLRILINYHQFYFRLFVHELTPNNQSPVIIIDAHAIGDGPTIVALLDSYSHVGDFVLPCAAFFAHARQQFLATTFLAANEFFAANLNIFNHTLAPLNIDIEHVHTDCYEHAIGLQ